MSLFQEDGDTCFIARRFGAELRTEAIKIAAQAKNAGRTEGSKICEWPWYLVDFELADNDLLLHLVGAY